MSPDPKPATALLTLVLCLSLGASAGAHGLPGTIDAFAGAPTAAELAAGLEKSPWVGGEEILGEQREMTVEGERLRLAWDGPDFDPDLDHTGLGGVDLTAGGRHDRLVLEVAGVAAPAEARLSVYSDHRRASSHVFELKTGISKVEIPFARLAAVGAAADLRDVGSLVLELPRAAAISLRGLRTASSRGTAAAPSPEAPASKSEGVVIEGPAGKPITVIAQEGDTPPGGGGNAITTLGAPFTNGNGQVGFTGAVDDGGSSDNFVWFNDDVTWLNSDAVGATLTGAESTMGIGDGGEFFYSPSTDGDDSAWSQNGQVAVEDTQAPGFPAGTNSTFHSRPTMSDGGQAHWVAGFNESGGTSSEGRMLYTSSDATPGNTAVVLRSDDMVGGFTIDRPSGIDFDYNFSGDGSHHAQVLLMDTGGTTDDGFLYVDGALVARETDPTGDGDNWDNFDLVSINNAGNYVFSGDTDGATATDEFIAYDGSIAIRQGDTLRGVTLGSSVSGLSLNDLGQAVFIWDLDAGGEGLFFAFDASDLAGTSVLLLATGDSVDVDGNGTGDATLTDFNASTVIGPGLSLAEDGRVLLEVDLDFGGGDVEAIIALGLPDPLVINEIDYAQSGTDSEEFIEVFNPTAGPVGLAGYALELVDGAGGGASVYQTIPLPDVTLAAGDFFVVCADAAMVPNCDLDVTPDTDLIEDGAPDAVGLTFLGGVIDAVSYDGDSGAPYVEGSGTGLVDDPSTDFFSISRTTDGADSDQNNVDLAGRCNSPGLPNLATTTGCVMVPVELQSFTVE